jgi:hypothetical protein
MQHNFARDSSTQERTTTPHIVKCITHKAYHNSTCVSAHYRNRNNDVNDIPRRSRDDRLALLRQLRDLLTCLEETPTHRLYAASLLIVYAHTLDSVTSRQTTNVITPNFHVQKHDVICVVIGMTLASSPVTPLPSTSLLLWTWNGCENLNNFHREAPSACGELLCVFDCEAPNAY